MADLPTEFDLILVGTGMIESMVAAAASRVGKRVLHLDNVNYYGGMWASFNLDAINSFSKPTTEKNSLEVVKCEGETVLPLGNTIFSVNDISQKWNVEDNPPDSDQSVETTQNEDTEVEAKEETNWTKEKLLNDSRKFNIDLAPKLQFARGDFVELLISSNIARYSEFCSISRVLTMIDDHLEVVPCSRSDVFSNSKVTVIEKRMLMKLLGDCLDGEDKEFSGYENKTFLSYLKDRKLTDNLIHYVLYAISMSTEKTPFLKGVENTKRFLSSLGRFGKTPFLYSLYGSGDLTQAFCRLSAVFGGIYALDQPLNGVILDENNKFKGIVCGSTRIFAKNLVCSIEKAPMEIVKNIDCEKYISRGIFITDKSILPSDKDFLTLLLYPPENGRNHCIVIEAGYVTKTCPKGLYIVYIYTEKTTDPETDIQHCIEKLFNTSNEINEKPKALWSFYYSTPNLMEANLRNGVPENMFLCPGPDMDLDYDPAIKKAKEIFSAMYDDEEFLPRAPDPEEIIIGDEATEESDIVTEQAEVADVASEINS